MTRRIRRLKVTLANAAAFSLTSDMWTSNNMDSYLAVTCHYIDVNTCLRSSLLGVVHFPETHHCELGKCQNQTDGGMGYNK